MEEIKREIIYSEPVEEIMGSTPRKILRWGTSVIFFVFVLFILFAWLIKYPDTIPAPIEITTMNPPVNLVAKVSGHIRHLYVQDKQKVKSGELLAVMETTASMEEIKLLKHTIDTIGSPVSLINTSLPVFSRLGELQEYYTGFMKNLSDLNTYIVNDFYGSKISSLTIEINSIINYIQELEKKEQLYSENKRLEKRKFQRDSLLYSNGVIPESELDNSRQSFIIISIDLQQVRLDHSSKTIELAEKRQLLQDYIITKKQEQERLISVLNESFFNLKAQTKIWENNYLLISPINGTVSFTKYWSQNQSVLKDEPVINVIPAKSGDLLGRIKLKMQRSGKVKEGQLVNIKLSGYPYLEYGMVLGVIRSKSLVPSGDAYVIDVSLPEGLTTLYEIHLEFTQNMQGTAEIITEDITLLQKIFNPFKYIVSRNKR